MLAFLASFVLIAYVLIPGTLYRTVFSFFIPPRYFQRTKADEIRFAVLASVLPFFFALLIMSATDHPRGVPDSFEQRRLDNLTVVAGAYSEQVFRQDPSHFWEAFNRVMRRQTRLLAWYYLGLAVEAMLLGAASRRLWRFLGKAYLRWIAEQFLVPQISEWYLLLTPATFPPKPALNVQLDLLTSDDHLYRGLVVPGSYFLDKEGMLTGVMLKQARRFDRRKYLQDEMDPGSPKAERYWKEIPGHNLFVPYKTILSLNIRYEPKLSVDASTILNRILSEMGIDGSVTEYEA
jgi:hypothetical protein